MTHQKTRKKKLKSQSLTEFKAWLTGVEEMQDEGWLPTFTQWTLIRERINLITVPQSTDIVPKSNPQDNGAYIPNQSVPYIPNVPSAFDNAAIVHNEAPLVAPAPRPSTGKAEGTVKTPDIDTSGGYNSGFL